MSQWVYTYENDQVQSEKLIIFFHGYGSHGEDLLSLAPAIKNVFPAAAFVAPNGFNRLPDYQEGYQWFALRSLDPEELKKNCKAVQAQGVDLIQVFQKKYGVGPENTILVGFSQGTFMSLYCALSHANLCRAVVGFGGGLSMDVPDMQGDPKKLEIALLHGMNDDVVRVDASQGASKLLEEKGFNVRLHCYKGLGHSISARGLEDMCQFLRNL